MTRSQFEEVVEEALRTLPREFRGRLENIVVEVRDRPTRRQLETAGVPPGDLLLGLYEGVPLTDRPEGVEPLYPDRVFLFQESLEECCETRQELLHEIRETVIHEVGHFFGLSDDEMEE